MLENLLLPTYTQQEVIFKLVFGGIIGMIPWIWIALAPDPRKKVKQEVASRTVSECSSHTA